MPEPLTRSQRTVLIRAGKDDKATAKCVPRITGQALQRRGYGYYHAERRLFHLNGAGLQYTITGETLEEKHAP